MNLNFRYLGDDGYFPLHTIMLRHRLIMMTPTFVTGNNAVQEGISFVTVPMKMLEWKTHAVSFVFSHQLTGCPLCTHLLISILMTYSVDCFRNDIQTICPFSNTNPPILHNGFSHSSVIGVTLRVPRCCGFGQFSVDCRPLLNFRHHSTTVVFEKH